MTLKSLIEIIQTNYQGKYIVLEGLDGSGKTSLKDWLEEQLTNTFSVREPGSTEFGEEIRYLLLNSKHKLQALTELFLFMASRTELLNQKVIPALKDNKIVLSDRSYISSFAYQAYPANISVDYFEQTVKQIYCQQKIDVILYAKVDYRVGLARSGAVRAHDNMEAKGDQFYQRTEAGYNLYLENFKAQAQAITNLAYVAADKAHEVEVYQNAQGTYLVILNAQLSEQEVRELFVQTLASLQLN